MKIVNKEVLYKGFYQLNKLFLKNSNNGEMFDREQFQTPNSIGVLLHDKKNSKIVLVEQFRIGPEKKLLEIVAGKVENDDVNLEQTASREVMEECGFEIEQIQLIHRFYTGPGQVTEQMSLYYAVVGERVFEGGGLADENEEIEVKFMGEDEFIKAKFTDAKTIIAQQWFQLNIN